MKILHCCLAAFYIDGYGYQENVLPKMHKLQGHNVRIVASTETFIDNKSLGYVQPSEYENEDGIIVTRIPYTKLLPHKIVKKLRIYIGLKNILAEFKPDIIFLHDIQFYNVKDIVSYVKMSDTTKVFADSHTDFINSAKSWVSKNILHKIIYKYYSNIIEPFTDKFYGTLPLRNIFLEEVYNIPSKKITLLELGADDSLYDYSKKNETRKLIRKELAINSQDLVIITGGKLDKRKNIHLLMDAFGNIKEKDIKLIVYGVPDKEMEVEINRLSKLNNIIYLGWLEPKKVYNYLFASDLAFFPGTHSVAWEQVTGVGLPAIFKKWNNIQHVDVGGNCQFIDNVSVNSILDIIYNLYNNRELLKTMKIIAETKGIDKFTYSKIAIRSIES